MRGVLLCCLLWPLLAAGGEILDAGVSREGAGFSVFITARIDAPVVEVRRAITDYANLATINPSIIESRLLPAVRPGSQRIRTVVRVCILVFCKDVVQEQDVTETADGYIEAVMVPGHCDFRSGLARWKLDPEGAATRLHFTHVFVPDFWVPPIIGPWLIRNKLVQEVEVTMRHIEQ